MYCKLNNNYYVCGLLKTLKLHNYIFYCKSSCFSEYY